jgi:RimJ/RimL family protein N-acetyltransferase
MCIIETSPVIETRRLVLRAPAPQDVTRIASMANDREIARMTCRMPHPFGTGDAEDFVIAVAGQDPARASPS